MPYSVHPFSTYKRKVAPTLREPLRAKEDCGFFDSLSTRLVAAANQGTVDEHAFKLATDHVVHSILTAFPTADCMVGRKVHCINSVPSRTLFARTSPNSLAPHLRANELALRTHMHFDACGLPQQQPVAGGFAIVGKAEGDITEPGYTTLTVSDVPPELMCKGFVQHLLTSHPAYSCSGMPLAHVAAEYMHTEVLACGKAARISTNTIVALIIPPADDRALKHLPRTLEWGEGPAVGLGFKFDRSVPPANPPPPPGPPPSASRGQVGPATDAPVPMDTGGASVGPSDVQEFVMVEAAVAAASPGEEVPPLEDPVRCHEDSASQRTSSCLQWLEDNDNVQLSGGESQYSTKEQQIRAVELVRAEHASEFFSPHFTGTVPHRDLQDLLTETLQRVFNEEGFTQGVRRSPRSHRAPPTQQGTGAKKKGPKGPKGPPRNAPTQRGRARTVPPAQASASARTSSHTHVAVVAACRAGQVPVSPRLGRGRFEGTQAVAGPSGVSSSPAHRSLSPVRLSRTASQGAVVRRSDRLSQPPAGIYSPRWFSSPKG